MRNIFLGLIALFCLGTFTFTSCEEDDGGCTVCSYVRPDNNETTTADPLCRDTNAELDEWEEIFKNEVQSVGPAWADIEITCERE